MLRNLRRGLVLLTFMVGVLPVQQQDNLQTLVADLFPGQYWIEISGALSNKGVMTQRVEEPSLNNIHQSSLPFMLVDHWLIDPDRDDYLLTMDATIHDPDEPDSLTWADLRIYFYNVIGNSSQMYELISPEEAEARTASSPVVAAYLFLPHRDVHTNNYAFNAEGNVYVEEHQEGDVFDRLIAFDFTAENEQGEVVQVRGAVYDRRLNHAASYENTPSGEAELAIMGEIGAKGTNVLTIQVSPETEAGSAFQFESEFTGSLRSEPDQETYFTLHAEIELPEPVICDFDNLQFSAGDGEVTLSVNDEHLEIEDLESDTPTIVICYDDETRTTVSGSIAYFQHDPDDLSRYVSFRLYYRAIPITLTIESET